MSNYFYTVKNERLFIKLCNCYLSIYLFLLNSELKLKVFFHTCLAWSTVYCVKTQNSKKLFGCLVTYGRNCIDQSQHWNHLFGSMVFWGCPVSSGSITLGSCVLWAYSFNLVPLDIFLCALAFSVFVQLLVITETEWQL